MPEGSFVLYGPSRLWMVNNAWEGLQELKKLCYSDIFYFQQHKKSEASDLRLVEQQIEQGVNLLWFFENMVNPQTLQYLVNQYPHQHFAVICEGQLRDPKSPQIVNVFYQVEEAAYLAGYMAAKMSRTGFLGVISVVGDSDSSAYAYDLCRGSGCRKKD